MCWSWIHVLSAIYIKKQNKTAITKKETIKAKRKKKKRRKEEKVLPEIEIGTFSVPGHIMATRPRGTCYWCCRKYVIKTLSTRTSASATSLKLIKPY